MDDDRPEPVYVRLGAARWRDVLDDAPALCRQAVRAALDRGACAPAQTSKRASESPSGPARNTGPRQAGSIVSTAGVASGTAKMGGGAGAVTAGATGTSITC